MSTSTSTSTARCPFEGAAARLAEDAAGVRPACEQCAAPDPFEMLSGCHRHLLQACDALEHTAWALQADGQLTDERLARLCEVIVLLDVAVPLHIEDEEHTLFPILQSRDPAGAGPSLTMHREHEQHEPLGYALRSAVLHRDPRAIARAALALAQGYRHHIEQEEAIMIPWARRVVPDAQARRYMVEEMLARRERAGVVGC